MGDLDEAIRDHLELKRRRGADPAEVAREEQEALAPVTRGHAIVVPEDLGPPPPRADDVPRNGDARHDSDHAPHDAGHGHHDPGHADHDAGAAPSPAHEDLGDATQEFRVVLGDSDDWLEDDEEA
jgi:Zn-dependent M28 family amino/carboxypeptidase